MPQDFLAGAEDIFAQQGLVLAEDMALGAEYVHPLALGSPPQGAGEDRAHAAKSHTGGKQAIARKEWWR